MYIKNTPFILELCSTYEDYINLPFKAMTQNFSLADIIQGKILDYEGGILSIKNFKDTLYVKEDDLNILKTSLKNSHLLMEPFYDKFILTNELSYYKVKSNEELKQEGYVENSLGYYIHKSDPNKRLYKVNLSRNEKIVNDVYQNTHYYSLNMLTMKFEALSDDQAKDNLMSCLYFNTIRNNISTPIQFCENNLTLIKILYEAIKDNIVKSPIKTKLDSLLINYEEDIDQTLKTLEYIKSERERIYG